MAFFLNNLAPVFALQDWLSVAIDGALALIAAMVVFRIVRRATAAKWFSHSAIGLMLRRSEPSLQSILPIVALRFVFGFAPDALAHIDAARRLITVALISAITFAIARLIAAFGEWIVRKHPFDVADNLEARRVLTQTRVVVRTINTLVVLIGLSAALITFPAVRQFGVSILASAGAAGLVVGFAAKPVLGNLLAGLQIAITQPMRIDDVLIVEGEWGRVEEITSAYVVVRIWDQRRLIVPLQWFIEHPFQNWTRTSAEIMGSVMLWLDFRMPLEPLRAEVKRIVEQAPEWDRRVCVLQVTDASDRAMQIRVLLSSADSGRNWDLRCAVREGLLRFIQGNYPDCFPRVRAEFDRAASAETTRPDPAGVARGGALRDPASGPADPSS